MANILVVMRGGMGRDIRGGGNHVHLGSSRGEGGKRCVRGGEGGREREREGGREVSG